MKVARILINLFVFSLLCGPVLAQQHPTPAEPVVLSMKERSDVINKILEQRLNRVVPELMRREEIDMWILIAQEYNEDPVLLTMLPATWQSARRTTIILFSLDPDKKAAEKMAVSRYNIGFFQTKWNPEENPGQWDRLAEVIEERNPRKIGVNYSDTFALADGISHTNFTKLKNSLPPAFKNRIVSAENLAIGWLETRTPVEIAVYRHINRIAHSLIEEGLSEAAITPGVTTTSDLEWWWRERIRERKLTAWFHPSVSIQRADGAENSFISNFSDRPPDNVIQPGDLIHVDFGITYLRLNTDTQRHAYVLRPGETEAPAYLKKALKTGNRLQDILTTEFRTGRSGNEILKSALEKAKEENIKATIYTHPIGYHGHGAGPTIGLWDQQAGVPGKGDYPLYPNTAHSIELNAGIYIAEWGKNIRIMLEEDAIFDGNRVEYIDGRLKELYLIPRQN